MAIGANRKTRLGQSGYMTRPYGSFAGKTQTAAPAVTAKPVRFHRNLGRLMHRR